MTLWKGLPGRRSLAAGGRNAPNTLVVPYRIELQKDAESHYAEKHKSLYHCLASDAMPRCVMQANEAASAAAFKSRVGQMSIWNGCTAQGGVTISGAVTNGDGLPMPGVKILIVAIGSGTSPQLRLAVQPVTVGATAPA